MERLFLLQLLRLLVAAVAIQQHIVQAVPVQLYGLNFEVRRGADWNPNKCKSREEVSRDLSLLSRLTNRFRILSLTDCGQGELVLDVARELGLKIWLGIWVSEDEAVFLYELAVLQDMLDRGLIDDTVLGISVGSESIYREEVTANQIIGYKDQVKQVLVDSGKGDADIFPVAICDIAPTFQYNFGLISESDIVMTNSFPFWEGVNINRAIERLETQISPISNFAATENKQVILGETGWPSAGYIPGVGIAGPALQAQYFTEFYCRMHHELGWQYYYFTGIDNAWRQEQDKNNTIEGNWGFLYVNMTLKPHYQNLEFTCPNSATPNVVYTLSEIDWTVPTVVAPPTVSPAPISVEACQAHSACRDAGLFGNCCPGSNGMYLACCDSDIVGGGVDGDDTMTATPSAATSTTSDTDPPSGPPITTGSSSNATEFPTTAPEATTALPTTSPPVLAAAPSMAPTASDSSSSSNDTAAVPTVSPSSVSSSNNSTDPISNNSTSTTVPTTTPISSVSPSMTPSVSPLNANNTNSTTEEPASSSEAPTTPTTSSLAPSSAPSLASSLTTTPEDDEGAATSVPQPTSSSPMLLLATGRNLLVQYSSLMAILAAPLLLL
jgi:glucan 1,3-beta-glucosidase